MNLYLSLRWVNCTIEIVREDKYQWGEVFENGTGNGVIGSVVEDRADVGICSLLSIYTKIFYKCTYTFLFI